MEDSGLSAKTSQIQKLIQLVETLRSEKGCPWDRKQTPQTIAVYLMEEMYELVQAIGTGDFGEICEELGDVLFQIVFLARQFEEQGRFHLGDVAAAINAKMIRRHPHVFADDYVQSAEDVPARWQAIKAQEPNHKKHDSILDSIPKAMPALLRAYRVSARAARAGFDWTDMAGVLRKAEEEWAELKAELGNGIAGEAAGREAAVEFGDVLFTLVNVARFARIHPETALSDAIYKFERRFRAMEERVRQSGRTLDAVSHQELNGLWDGIKAEES